TLDGEIGVADLRSPQRNPDRIQQRFQMLGFKRRQIDFEQKVRTALQIEAEIDLVFREPGGHGLQPFRAEKVGQRDDDAGEDNGQHHPDLPFFELDHDPLRPLALDQPLALRPLTFGSSSASASSCPSLPLLLAGSVLANTSETVDRATLTRTPSA